MQDGARGRDAARQWLWLDWEMGAVFRGRAGEPSATQWHILNSVANSGPLTLMATAAYLGVTGATAARAVAAAARHGWLVKDRDPQDRRGVWLRITPSGEAAVAATTARVADRLAVVADLLPGASAWILGVGASPDGGAVDPQ